MPPSYLIQTESLDARSTQAIVDLRLTVRSGESHRTLARVIPDLIDTRAVVQARIRRTFVEGVLALRTDVIIETHATVTIDQRNAQAVVQAGITRAVIDHRRTGRSLNDASKKHETMMSPTMYPCGQSHLKLLINVRHNPPLKHGFDWH